VCEIERGRVDSAKPVSGGRRSGKMRGFKKKEKRPENQKLGKWNKSGEEGNLSWNRDLE
jgi:hypothetical protein